MTTNTNEPNKASERGLALRAKTLKTCVRQIDMSYIVTILKIRDYEETAIEEDLFRVVIEKASDLEFVETEFPGVVSAKWTGHPESKDVMFDFAQGQVEATTPDDYTLIRMQELAKEFGARLRGEEGEFLDDIEITPRTGCGSACIILIGIITYLLT